MTSVLQPEIELEKALAAQIYNALQGDVVRFILKNAQDTTDDDYWRSRMEGHCMKADKNLLGNFYRLCHEVKERLGFHEPVDFFVTGDSSINAFSIAAEDGQHSHIVNVNSELFNLMSEDELKFVIGHEKSRFRQSLSSDIRAGTGTIRISAPRRSQMILTE